MNIIELAKQAGMEQDGDMWFSNIYKTDMDVHISHLEAFAKLVAAHEREECAKVAEDSDHVVDGRGYHDQLGDANATAKNITAAIRVRGNT